MKKIILLLFFCGLSLSVFAQYNLFKVREDIALPSVEYGYVQWIDYDNDKDFDLIVSGVFDIGATLTKCYKNNDGKFEEIKEFLPVACRSGELQFGDFDNDGYKDVLVVGAIQGSGTFLFKNNRGNSFTEITTFKVENMNSTNAGLADFDNDGDLDMLLQGTSKTPDCGVTVAKLYVNVGNFSFREVIGHNIKGFAAGNISWADFDNDKDLDLINAGFVDCSFAKKAMIYENLGQNKFLAKEDFNIENKIGEVSWADYNKDGWVDMLQSGSGNTYNSIFTKIYENQQGKSFKLLEFEIPPASSVKWADFDNDKQLDFLLSSGRINDVEKEFAGIYFGKNNTFFRDTSLNLSTFRAGIVGVGDYDNDGDIDFFLSGRGVENQAKLSTFIYENQLIPIVPKPLRIVEADTEKIVLQWDSLNRVAVSDDIVFFLEKSLDGSNFTTIESFKNLEKLQYIDKDVKENIAYSYRLKSTNQFGKVNYSNLVVASILITSFEDSNIENKIAIFPNPSTGIVSIESAMLLENNYQIFLSDCLGRTVFNHRFAGNLHNYQIDLSSLSNGIYQLCVLWEGKRVYKKMVKM
jgi:hypothetical protein